jgi:hypothetical protein
MSPKDLRRINLYLNSRSKPYDDPSVVSGKMGSRDPNTGRYRTSLNNNGTLQSRYIGNGSRPQGYTTEIDVNGWTDS